MRNNLILGVLLYRNFTYLYLYLIIYMRKWMLFSCLLMSFMFLRAENVKTDSVRISLLTCAPGNEIYALFGHTAIRYENYTRKQDLVFNYGMFSFNTPNFVMRFLMGKTDYQLGVVPYSYFELEYAERGSSVYQQVLNLTTEEKANLVKLLDDNYHPSRRTYRYNYFYDNCTTRARDKIEEAIVGKVTYLETDKVISYRDIIHEFTKGNEWSELGIDLCLGTEADKPIDERKQMFAPFYMLEAARHATIKKGNEMLPLVAEEETIVQVESYHEPSPSPVSPFVCFITLLVLSIAMAWWSNQKGKVLWWWDILLFGAQGLGGCIIAFLFFFSVHPTVSSNWMLVLFNPLPLFYLPFMVYKAVKGKKDNFHLINVVCLTLFMIFIPFLPQKFNISVLPLTLCLWVCSVGHLILYYRKSFK